MGESGEDQSSAKKRTFLGKIRDRDEALSTVKEAGYTFCGLGVLQGAVLYWISGPNSLIDGAAWVLLGGALLAWKSRTAAVFSVALAGGSAIVTVANRLGLMAEGGRNIFLAFIVLWIAVKAVEGTFKFHKFEKVENPDYVSSSKVTFAVAGSIGALFLVATIYGLMSVTGFVPQTEIVEGTKVTNEEREILVGNAVLFQDEEIEYFYSHGLTSVAEGGSVLSDHAVIAYGPDDSGNMQVYEFTFDKITSVELVEQGNWANDSIYRVNAEGEGWLLLYLSTENGGDVRFVEALRTRLSR